MQGGFDDVLLLLLAGMEVLEVSVRHLGGLKFRGKKSPTGKPWGV